MIIQPPQQQSLHQGGQKTWNQPSEFQGETATMTVSCAQPSQTVLSSTTLSTRSIYLTSSAESMLSRLRPQEMGIVACMHAWERLYAITINMITMARPTKSETTVRSMQRHAHDSWTMHGRAPSHLSRLHSGRPTMTLVDQRNSLIPLQYTSSRRRTPISCPTSRTRRTCAASAT